VLNRSEIHMQTQFKFNSRVVSKETYNSFRKLIGQIVDKLRNDAVNESVLDSLFLGKKVLKSEMLKDNESPEDYTRKNFIDKMLLFLGYSESEIKTATNLQWVDRRSETDYKLVVDATPIYGEAESINKDLEGDKTGLNQVKGWLEQKQTKSDYGFATDGIRWVLIKYDNKKNIFITLEDINLIPFFTSLLTRQQETEQIIENLFQKFYNAFSRKNILIYIHIYLISKMPY